MYWILGRRWNRGIRGREWERLLQLFRFKLLLGCNFEFLLHYIESLFLVGELWLKIDDWEKIRRVCLKILDQKPYQCDLRLVAFRLKSKSTYFFDVKSRDSKGLSMNTSLEMVRSSIIGRSDSKETQEDDFGILKQRSLDKCFRSCTEKIRCMAEVIKT